MGEEAENDTANLLAPRGESEDRSSVFQSPKPATSSNADAATRVLQFLADASNETLAGFFVILLIVLMLIFGRIGSVLVGVLTGVVLHATWNKHKLLSDDNNNNGDGRTKSVDYKGSGMGVAQEILAWRAQRQNAGHIKGEEEATALTVPLGTEPLDFSSLRPETGAALSDFTDAVVRDYVRWWYAPILPNETSFLSACKGMLTSFLLSASMRLARKRPADMFLDVLANTSSIVIVFLNELGIALSTSSSTSASLVDDVDGYIKANPEGTLANLINHQDQEKKLYMIAEDILQSFLEPSVHHCGPAYIFLREIFVGVILKMTLASCSKPEWVNGYIVSLLEDEEVGETKDAAADLNGMASSSEVSQEVENAGPGSREKSSTIGEENNTASAAVSDKQSVEQGIGKADAAMKQALLEAEKMNRLIAEEEERRKSMAKQARNESSTSSLVSRESRDVEDDGTFEPHASDSALDLARPGLAIDDARTREMEAFGAGVGPNSPDRASSPYSSSSPMRADKAAQDEESFTLYNANVTILQDSASSTKGTLSAKPNMELLLQIEPRSSAQRGWMIARKYSDFEKLHEVLRRISVISGVSEFQIAHGSLPSWKKQKRAELLEDLEKYLRDALSFRLLAESEKMKRFLEKDDSMASLTGGKGGFPNAIGNMGKGMRDVLVNAPKNVGGVISGVGSLGQKKNIKTPGKPAAADGDRTRRGSGVDSTASSTARDRGWTVSSRNRNGTISASPVGSSKNSQLEGGLDNGDTAFRLPRLTTVRPKTSAEILRHHTPSPEIFPSYSEVDGPQQPLEPEIEEIYLPPPPNEIPDDYGSATIESVRPSPRDDTLPVETRPSLDSMKSVLAPIPAEKPLAGSTASTGPNFRSEAQAQPLTEQEAQVAVDLFFAMINELYNLSSAWNIRRTLLTAAKNFINLETIRQLIQSSVIDAFGSDAAIARSMRATQDTALPTEEQLKAWPKPLSEEEKETLRMKARRLLVERGLPPALTGVMGGAASREALGKVFDCLQIEEISRGLMFGLMLQVLRVVTQ
ncbi:MAG: hypothetical protein M1826_001751 [Phylliscum demangeonii]|nr:MAG: hypothetical protein M1826_001751 [Phylliscum demangeonii]